METTLEEFDFEIQYKKGRVVADALSRIEVNMQETDRLETESMIANINEIPEITNEDLERIFLTQASENVQTTN